MSSWYFKHIYLSDKYHQQTTHVRKTKMFFLGMDTIWKVESIIKMWGLHSFYGHWCKTLASIWKKKAVTPGFRWTLKVELLIRPPIIRPKRGLTGEWTNLVLLVSEQTWSYWWVKRIERTTSTKCTVNWPFTRGRSVLRVGLTYKEVLMIECTSYIWNQN